MGIMIPEISPEEAFDTTSKKAELITDTNLREEIITATDCSGPDANIETQLSLSKEEILTVSENEIIEGAKLDTVVIAASQQYTKGAMNFGYVQMSQEEKEEQKQEGFISKNLGYNQDLSTLIYPNPITAGNELTISFPGSLSVNRIFLFNSSGQLILLKELNGQKFSVRFTIPQTASGIYFLQLIDERGRLIETKKLIIR